MQTNILSQQQDVQTEINMDWAKFWKSFDEILYKIIASGIKRKLIFVTFNRDKYQSSLNRELENAYYAALSKVILFRNTHAVTAMNRMEDNLPDKKSPHIAVIDDYLLANSSMFLDENLGCAIKYFSVLRKKEILDFDGDEKKLRLDFHSMFPAYSTNITSGRVWQDAEFYFRMRSLEEGFSEKSCLMFCEREESLAQQVKIVLYELYSDIFVSNNDWDSISSQDVLERVRKTYFLGSKSTAYRLISAILKMIDGIPIPQKELILSLDQLFKHFSVKRQEPLIRLQALIKNMYAYINDFVSLMTAQEGMVKAKKEEIRELENSYLVSPFQFPDRLVSTPAHCQLLVAEIFAQFYRNQIEREDEDERCFVSFDSSRDLLQVNMSEALKNTLVSLFNPAHSITYFTLLLLTVELIRVKDKVLPHKDIIKRLIAALLKGDDCTELLKSPFFVINIPEFLFPYLTAKIVLPHDDAAKATILAEIDKLIPPVSFSEGLELFSKEKLNYYMKKCFSDIPETHRHSSDIVSLLESNSVDYPVVNKSLLCAYSLLQCYKPFEESAHEISVMATCRKNTQDHYQGTLKKFEAVFQGEVSVVSLLDFLSEPLEYQDEPLSNLLSILKEMLLDYYQPTMYASDVDSSSDETVAINQLTRVKVVLFGGQDDNKASVFRPGQEVPLVFDN